jgi:hypothetical protein
MKKIFISLFMISSLCCSQVVGPKISTQQASYDFGSIPAGEKVSHDFIIYNTGDDTLVINDVRASCGCTAAKPEKNNYSRVNLQKSMFSLILMEEVVSSKSMYMFLQTIKTLRN